MTPKSPATSQRLVDAIDTGSLSRLAPALARLKPNLSREKPDYANIQDRRSGQTVGDALELLGNAFADGASGIGTDIRNTFRKEDPKDLVMRKLKEATPSVSTKKSKSPVRY
jgi:hypothetical protein